MFLFFDTETTGLPRSWSAPVENLENWPRLVQIAWMIYDKNGIKQDEKEFIIKPEGFNIPEDSARIHGITQAKAMECGQDLKTILQKFYDDYFKVDFLVAHNYSFDEKIIGAELLRQQMDNFLPNAQKICTMEATRDFCKIPSTTSAGYKWPKLSELHIKLFGEDFSNAHDAFVDTKACARCFFELIKRKEIVVLQAVPKHVQMSFF